MDVARTWPMTCTGKNACGWRWDQALTGAPASPVHCPRCRKPLRVTKRAWDRSPAGPGPVKTRPLPAARRPRAEPAAGARLLRKPDRVPERPAVTTPAGPAGDGPPARRAAAPTARLVSAGGEAGPDWPGAVPLAARWCAACRAGRKRAVARYQVELSVPPFAADVCGTCLARLWREAPQAVRARMPSWAGWPAACCTCARASPAARPARRQPRASRS